MRIGRWSELSIDRVCQEHEMMRDADANETSDELCVKWNSRGGVPGKNTISQAAKGDF